MDAPMQADKMITIKTSPTTGIPPISSYPSSSSMMVSLDGAQLSSKPTGRLSRGMTSLVAFAVALSVAISLIVGCYFLGFNFLKGFIFD